jgi:DNA-binding transcriptional ArsR family regulator
MPSKVPPVGRVFHALAAPIRREVLERLALGPLTTAQLAEPVTMALPSFLEHLGVLEECGLVRSNKVGRIRTWTLIPRRLDAAERWLVRQRQRTGSRRRAAPRRG